jgi:hypothetical protein
MSSIVDFLFARFDQIIYFCHPLTVVVEQAHGDDVRDLRFVSDCSIPNMRSKLACIVQSNIDYVNLVVCSKY